MKIPAWGAAKAHVFNRGGPPDSFLNELLVWGASAPDEIFAQNTNPADIYSASNPELGPWENLTHRRAVMLEVMRVLAGFESSWNWHEGVDTSRAGADTPANAEAGAWQVSADSLDFGADLRDLVMRTVRSTDGRAFQLAMKTNHPLAMEYVARLMRHTIKHNGPLYRDRSHIRESLRGQEHSIYPWLSRESVDEFREALS